MPFDTQLRLLSSAHLRRQIKMPGSSDERGPALNSLSALRIRCLRISCRDVSVAPGREKLLTWKVAPSMVTVCLLMGCPPCDEKLT